MGLTYEREDVVESPCRELWGLVRGRRKRTVRTTVGASGVRVSRSEGTVGRHAPACVPLAALALLAFAVCLLLWFSATLVLPAFLAVGVPGWVALRRLGEPDPDDEGDAWTTGLCACGGLAIFLLLYVAPSPVRADIPSVADVVVPDAGRWIGQSRVRLPRFEAGGHGKGDER